MSTFRIVYRTGEGDMTYTTNARNVAEAVRKFQRNVGYYTIVRVVSYPDRNTAPSKGRVR